MERIKLDLPDFLAVFSVNRFRRKKYQVYLPPETIFDCLCLNFVSLLMFSVMRPETDEDREAVEKCLRGDREAFDLLVEKYYKKIYNLAYRFVGDTEEASDLAQEIFTAAYKNLKKFRGDAKFSTWLFQIATNRGKNRFKYLKRRGYFASKGHNDDDDDRDSAQRAIPDYSMNPETMLASKKIQRIVQQAIDDLDPDHKEIVILRDIEGFSYDEIAQMLNLPEGTTKSRLHRARMVVKEKLKKALS
jgi:RNA polymerase sigma-70 factor (ECF subfamily)